MSFIAEKKLKIKECACSLSLSPAGHLYLYDADERAVMTETLSNTVAESIKSFFSISESVGLLRWNTVGRVCFHLAENKANAQYPFAFLATYTTGLSRKANTQHCPLGKALEEYAAQSKKSSLLSLLLPVHRAAENSIFLKNLV